MQLSGFRFPDGRSGAGGCDVANLNSEVLLCGSRVARQAAKFSATAGTTLGLGNLARPTYGLCYCYQTGLPTCGRCLGPQTCAEGAVGTTAINKAELFLSIDLGHPPPPQIPKPQRMLGIRHSRPETPARPEEAGFARM